MSPGSRNPPISVFGLHAIACRGAGCAAAAVCVGGLTAVGVRFAGISDDIRNALGFEFRPWEPTIGRALGIAAHNVGLVLAALVCAFAAPHLGRALQTVVDVALLAVGLQNAALVGAAWGAYGSRLGSSVVLHLPAELVAMSVAGAVYLSGRRVSLPYRVGITAALVCASILIVGGMLETYSPLQR